MKKNNELKAQYYFISDDEKYREHMEKLNNELEKLQETVVEEKAYKIPTMYGHEVKVTEKEHKQYTKDLYLSVIFAIIGFIIFLAIWAINIILYYRLKAVYTKMNRKIGWFAIFMLLTGFPGTIYFIHELYF